MDVINTILLLINLLILFVVSCYLLGAKTHRDRAIRLLSDTQKLLMMYKKRR